MGFKQYYQLITEVSEHAIQTAKERLTSLAWIHKLSDNDLNGYTREHPDAHSSTLKYIQKEILFRRNNAKKEFDEQRIKDILKRYKELHDKGKIQRGIDIQSTHIGDIENEVEKIELNRSKSELEKEEKKDVDKVFENDKVLVVRPLSHDASCYYGAGTKWCTTSKETKNHFQSYTLRGGLYYIIPKDKKEGKIAIFVHTTDEGKTYKEVYDEKDKNQSIEWFDKKLEKLSINKDIFIHKIREFNIDDIVEGTYEKDKDGYYIVKGNVKITDKKLKNLKQFKIKEVIGNFNCSGNELESLEGSPEIVKGDFSCILNKLKTLKGAPKQIGDKNFPNIGGSFYCTNNQLESLEYLPELIGNYCNLECSDNKLTSLKGVQKIITGSFWINNNKLKDFKDGPEKALRGYHVRNNPLESLDGLAKFIGGTLYLYTDKFSEEEIRKNREIVGKIKMTTRD
jgi:hypothetical protein